MGCFSSLATASHEFFHQHEKNNDKAKRSKTNQNDLFEMLEPAEDRSQLAAQIVCGNGPRPHPQPGAERIENQKSFPTHPAESGDDAVELPESLKETGDQDDFCPMPREKNLHLSESFTVQKNKVAIF